MQPSRCGGVTGHESSQIAVSRTAFLSLLELIIYEHNAKAIFWATGITEDSFILFNKIIALE